MMIKVFAIAFLVLWMPRMGSAQDTPFRFSLVAAVAAHGSDLASTENCLGSGRCRELNPWLARFDNPATFGAVKMGVAALSLWGTAKLHESHPRWAIAVNVAQAVGFSLVAARNARVGK
jgi:hypothetical protein